MISNTDSIPFVYSKEHIRVKVYLGRGPTIRNREVEEGISFRLKFPTELVVHGSSSYGATLSSFIFVQGTKGWASLAPVFPFDEVRQLIGKIGKRSFARKFKLIDEFTSEIDAFASAIQNKHALEADGVEGHRDMIIIDAIYESARTKQPVIIKY